MGQLCLYRHGQAAASGGDDGGLSELGERQARALGAHLLAEGASFDQVITGSLARQRETERLVAECYAEAGEPWPEAAQLPAWNEFDAGGVLGTLAPALRARDATFAALYEDFERHAASPQRNRYFQRMFEVVIDRWIEGEGAAGDTGAAVEGFAAFYERVSAARAAILAGKHGRKVAVFTSGGPIGVCVQQTLQAPDPMAVQINWRVQNGSITELVFSTNRVALDCFNRVPHLPAELRSYR